MSALGFGGYASPFIAGTAGMPAAQPAGSLNQRANAASEANLQETTHQLNEKSIGDVAENHGVDDRDADGRLPWSQGETSEHHEWLIADKPEDHHPRPLHPLDATGELGQIFDSDA